MFSDTPLLNVRRCWLAMPLVAGFLRWVLACRTIEKKQKVLFATTPHSYKNFVKSKEVYRIQGDRYLTCVTIRSFCVTATKPSTCIETITDRTAYST